MDYTLYEYEVLPYNKLDSAVLEPFIESIESLNRHHNKTLIEIGRHELRATQFVGILHTPYGVLNILPKIDRGAHGEGLALQNLVTMLCYSYDLPLITFGASSTQTVKGGWLELLTQLFCQLLYRELQHGIERVYVQVEERNRTLKGRWLIGQQLTRSPHIRHAFDVRYDEFSPDTPLNRVFLYVTDLLIGLSRTPNNRRVLTEILGILGTVSVPTHLSPDDVQAVTFTRLNERFKPAFHIAQMLIESLTVVLRSGSTPLRAFVFDMNDLFESFVAGFLSRHWRDIAGERHRDFYIQAQLENQSALYLAQDRDGKGVFKLIPDLILRDKNRQPRLILDTKYKRLTGESRNLDISQADVYQMVAYATRLECPNILLLYPSNGGAVIERRFKTEFTPPIYIDVNAINLHQPLADTRALIHDFRRIFAPYLSDY